MDNFVADHFAHRLGVAPDVVEVRRWPPALDLVVTHDGTKAPVGL